MAIVRSVVYLAAFGGFGYMLMKIVTPDERLIKSKYQEVGSEYTNETLRKRQAIVEVLRAAAESQTPMYRLTKEEIDAERNKDLGKKGP